MNEETSYIFFSFMRKGSAGLNVLGPVFSHIQMSVKQYGFTLKTLSGKQVFMSQLRVLVNVWYSFTDQHV